MENKLYYYGTTLNEAGHYLAILDGNSFHRADLRHDDLPFDPYELPNRGKKDPVRKGQKDFYQKGGYSILVIEGSCYDTRFGTRTVFFVKSLISEYEMMQLINDTPIAFAIVNKLPFAVEW